MHRKALTTLTSSGSDIIESISALHGRIYSENAEPNYIYYSKDQSESNLVLLNASNAQIREQNLFTDYGRNLLDSDCQSLSSNRYRYAGKEIVKNPTLQTPYINYGPRWYSPNDSRWMSPDGKAYLYPYLSPYSFCGADPINFKDPSGNDWKAVRLFFATEDYSLKYEFRILWTTATSQDDLELLNEPGFYLGEAVIIWNGYLNEKIGDDKTLMGNNAIASDVTIYGVNGPDDIISNYKGLSISSNNNIYPMIQEGDYLLYQEQMSSSTYRKGSLNYRISTLDGSLLIPPEGGYNKFTHKTYISDEYLHRTNWDGNAIASSKACLIIDARQWKSVEKQLKLSKKIFLHLTRE